MCGINGVYYFNQRAFDPASLREMCKQMIHRGPDDDGFFMGRGVGLSFRRLAIIDLEGAHQPIANEDGSIQMICNGEIYNYRSLRKELLQKGHRFRTAGDTETIIHLYEEYGKDCVHHLRGMFAFILWDSRTETFFAARDHFGIKPFYYTFDKEKLICSSELKSLLVTGHIAPRLDLQSLVYYLTFQYVPDPRTMLEGVCKLPPAHRLTAQNGSVQVERYWLPEFKPLEQPIDKIRREIREVLRDSVRLHMQSDVPVGCFLSSGIDSTAIAALMRELQPIKTFSVGFEGNNECEISRLTAAELQTEHYEQLISEEEYFNVLDDCIWFQDDPVADPSAIALYLVAKMAAEHVKVVLSGEGADELFGGYRIYQEPLALSPLKWMPKPFKESLHKIVSKMPGFQGKNYLLRATTPLEDRFVGNAKLFTDDLYEVLNEKNLLNRSELSSAFKWARKYYDQVQHLNDISKMQFIDINLWMPGNILAKADKMTMAHSLELRVPFLDKEVFAIAASIPVRYLVDRTTTKRALREAMQDLVPSHVINRPKLGFPVPLRDWLRGKRGDTCLALILSSGICQFINREYITWLVKQHQSGTADYARKIWNIFVLAQWYNFFIEEKKHTNLAGISSR